MREDAVIVEMVVIQALNSHQIPHKASPKEDVAIELTKGRRWNKWALAFGDVERGSAPAGHAYLGPRLLKAFWRLEAIERVTFQPLL